MLAGASLAGGAGNAAAGGGSLVTFPVLVALGLTPLTANVTNTLGHAPGYVSIVAGLREGLAGQRRRILLTLPEAIVGAGLGAALLSVGSPELFAAIAPALVLGACVMLAAQPALRRWLAARGRHSGLPRPVLLTGALAGCAYAAYFGAGAGFIVLATLAATIADDLQRLNALSRLLICVANLVALPILVALNPVDAAAAATLAPTTLLGGYAGAGMARRLPERRLRAVVLALGLSATVYRLAR